MGICYVSGLDEEKCKCSRCKGKYLGVDPSPLPTFEGLAFEDFCSRYLKGVPDVHGIARADDELMLYEYYKKYGNFVPNLKRIDGGYKHEYSKLEDWFSNRFFKVLRRRVALTDTQATEYYDNIKRDFLRFRSSINKIFLDMTSDQKYIGTADINPVLIFLKKVIRSIDITPSSGDKDILRNYVDYVDFAGNAFVPGSALFFLELYASLKDEHIIQKFQKLVEDMDSIRAKRLVKLPLLLLIPWDHQNEAFNAWNMHGKNGIIEMATATGKTLVGLMAIEAWAQTKRKGVVRIFAHSRAILNQWRREVIDKLGLIENIYRDFTTPIYCNGLEIHFNTVQTVYKRPEDFKADLLIVDEVHHGAAKEFRKALTIKCLWKMGLSATIEGGEREYWLRELLGPVVYQYPLQEALKDGIVPKFEWKLHTVYLSIEEERKFEEISRKINKMFKKIAHDMETVQKVEPKKDVINDLYDFIKLVEKARYRGVEIPDDWRLLQSLILQRRWLIHRSRPKLDHAIELAKYFSIQKKVIVFTMDINSCALIANELSQNNDNIFVIHSDIEEDVNKRIVQFKNAKYGALIGARMLDEGIDIPDAEIGINVSSSKTRLQLVQRMGRILRMQKDKRPVFHHYIAVPGPDYYLHEEDNLTFLDDLSWVQDTALKIGVHAEFEKEEIPFERLRSDAEEMIRKRFSERKIPTLPSYGTFRLEYVLSLLEDAIEKIVHQLNELDSDEQISDAKWATIVRKAHDKKIDEPLNIPGYWWILVLGNRTPQGIKGIFREYGVI